MSETNKRQPTITDVAEAAGVAIGTVSRYLNGLSIRTANRLAIEQAISELGYRRNLVAVSMKRQSAQVVGMMVPALTEFHAGLLDQLGRRLRPRGLAVMCFCHDQEERTIAEGLEFFAGHRVEAVVMDGLAVAAPILERHVADGLSVVLYDNDIPGLSADRVFTNNRGSSERLVSYLAELGHSRIATIAGRDEDSAGRERLMGYQDALEVQRLPRREEYVRAGYWTEAGGYAAMRDLLALPEPPTAVFSANYNMTMGALRWLREQKLDVPGDLSLVSFDDVPAWTIHPAGITAAGQPLAQLADTIASTLLERLEMGLPAGRRTLRIDANITLRGSAGNPRT